ncbi:ABC transporter permease [Paenibacillus xylanivorans]|uniref:MacB-like periplasmic core domain-containing protein n=1 Tax=Paenibacillus xylanivorans TaxID=1705561 RepID=A0A0M9BKS1_9BACL|nr:ABC transporter permease [Paenibacillus xylanivorans]KOY14203.1 hypothetical protein AMS66_22675 [Paenibacillus xylanivorans]
MNPFHFSIQDLWRHKGTSVILLIEMVILLIIVNLLFWSFNDMNKMEQEIERLNSQKEVYSFIDYTSENQIKKLFADDTHLQDLRKLYDSIYKNPEIEAFPLYSADLYTAKSLENVATLTPKDMNRVPFIYANPSFFNYFNLGIKEGRPFGEIDYTEKEQNIPVIIGSEMQSMFKLNQTFSDVSGKSYNVIGVLEDNSSYIDIMATRDFKNLDRMIILPQNLNYLSEVTNLDSVITRAYMATKNEDSLGNIVKLAADLNTYSFAYKSMKYQSEFVAQDKKKILQTQLLLSGLIFIFTFLTVTVSYLQFIERYTYDFGVHLLSGASIKDVMIRIGGQFIILTIISNLIVNLFFSWFSNLSISIVISLLVMIIFLVIPLMKLRYTPMNDMLRRKQK